MTARLIFLSLPEILSHTHQIPLNGANGMTVNLATDMHSRVVDEGKKVAEFYLPMQMGNAKSMITTRTIIDTRAVERWVAKNCHRDVLVRDMEYRNYELTFLDGWYKKYEFDAWWAAPRSLTDFEIKGTDAHYEILEWLKENIHNGYVMTNPQIDLVLVEIDDETEAAIFKLRWCEELSPVIA